MGDQRKVDQDGTTGEEGWRDDAAPTSTDLEIESGLDEDGPEDGDEDFEEEGFAEADLEDGEDDGESGAGYGNNNEVPPNPD